MFDWLRDGFEVLGVQFENWMPVSLAILVFWIVLEWGDERLRRQRRAARD